MTTDTPDYSDKPFPLDARDSEARGFFGRLMVGRAITPEQEKKLVGYIAHKAHWLRARDADWDDNLGADSGDDDSGSDE